MVRSETFLIVLKLTNLEISPHALIDDVLGVFQVLQMFPRYFLLITDNILNLLPQSFLDVWVVDEPKHHNAQGRRGRVEAGEEEENGRGDQADFEIFLGKEKILVIIIELFNEDINDVISLFTGGSSEYAENEI